MTAEEALRAAFAALLRGDTAERDRLCDLAKDLHEQEERIRQLRPSDNVRKQ